MQRLLDDVEIDLVTDERPHLAYLARVPGLTRSDPVVTLSGWAREIALLDELWASSPPA